MRPFLLPRLPSFALLAALLLLPSASLAQAQAEPSSELPSRLMEVRFSVLSGVPDLISISGSLTALRPLELELGASSLLLATSAYLRVGGVYTLHDARAAGGWTWELLFVGQYRFLETVPFDSVARSHGPGLNLGVDGTYWVLPRFGFHVQLVAGAVYWVSQDDTDAPALVPDVRLAAGIGF